MRFKKFIKQALQFLFIALIFSLAVDLWRGQSIQTKLIPQLQGSDIHKSIININLLSQKEPVLVYFWGTWCPVCSVVSPSINSLSKYYPVASVAMSSGTNEKLKTYMETNAYSFTVINDENSEIGKSIGVQVTPLIMIVYKGKLISYTTGYTSLIGMWWRVAKANLFQ